MLASYKILSNSKMLPHFAKFKLR